MVVDVLVPVGEKGGVENVINMTVPFLQRQGMVVRVVQFVASGVTWTETGIPYYALLEGLDGHTMAEFIESYVCFWKENGSADCILATSWPMMCYVARRAVETLSLTATSIISWLHAPVERYIEAGYGGYDYLAMADAHIAISEMIQRELTQHMTGYEICTVNNPVDLEKCSGNHSPKTDKSDRGEDVFSLYYVGRISEEKRLDLVIQAVAASGGRWELVVIGDDDTSYGLQMKKLANTCGIAEKVHWLGWKTEPWNYVSNATAVVLASDFEGCPLTAIEALANGFMVIATPVSGIEELIIPGVNGYLFPCGDWKALSDILYELAMGKRAVFDENICRKSVAKYERSLAVEDFYNKLCSMHNHVLRGREENIQMTKQQIYETNIQLQSVVNEIIYNCHIQNFDKVILPFGYLTDSLMQVLEAVFSDIGFYNQNAEVVNPEGISDSLQNIMMAQESQDYVLLADLLELQLLPFLQSLQEQIRIYAPVEPANRIWEQNLNVLKEKDRTLYNNLLEHHRIYEQEVQKGTWQGIYHLEDTNAGAYTLAGVGEQGTYYYHSNVNPVKEAVDFAAYYYHPESSHYVIWGLGLGYHVRELWNIDNGISILVYENDLDVIYHCMMAVDMSECLQSARVQIIHDPHFTKITDELDKMTENVILHYPSLRHIPDAGIREQMEMFFIRDSGKRNAAILFASNSRENFCSYDGYVDELQSAFQGKKTIIVAAGPSLDKNVELLKNKSEDTIIIAVETVFRKLIGMGVDVDYMIVTDANSRVYGHLAGLEQQQVPMLYLSTAYREFSMNYAGKKYLVCQDGYLPAEQLAQKNGWRLYQTGGSVSTTALDVCIQLGCSSIAFVGLDLAYTGDRAHADGTARTQVEGTEVMRQVSAIGGGTVATSRVFMMYNRWISKRLKQTDVTMPVYDATEGGAVISGMSVTTLKEYME